MVIRQVGGVRNLISYQGWSDTENREFSGNWLSRILALEVETQGQAQINKGLRVAYLIWSLSSAFSLPTSSFRCQPCDTQAGNRPLESGTCYHDNGFSQSGDPALPVPWGWELLFQRVPRRPGKSGKRGGVPFLPFPPPIPFTPGTSLIWGASALALWC